MYGHNLAIWLYGFACCCFPTLRKVGGIRGLASVAALGSFRFTKYNLFLHVPTTQQLVHRNKTHSGLPKESPTCTPVPVSTVTLVILRGKDIKSEGGGETNLEILLCDSQEPLGPAHTVDGKTSLKDCTVGKCAQRAGLTASAVILTNMAN